MRIWHTKLNNIKDIYSLLDIIFVICIFEDITRKCFGFCFSLGILVIIQ